MKQALCTVIIAGFFGLAPSIVQAAEAPAFAPSLLFNSDNRGRVDPSCSDAVAAYDVFAKDALAVLPPDALKSQLAFTTCARRSRLDPDMTRFLVLAAAGAAYVEAANSTGDEKTAAIRRGYGWADMLAPTGYGEGAIGTAIMRKTTDPYTPTTTKGMGTTIGGGAAQYKLETDRNALGASHDSWRYGELSGKVRDAFLALAKSFAIEQKP